VTASLHTSGWAVLSTTLAIVQRGAPLHDFRSRATFVRGTVITRLMMLQS
jgi:hypothetical protein